ncbi:MAG: hypothetical protein IPN36_15295 [Bacteroidetes bacterium]|nr:hypothetical protein [Bacteroidota bacterium]
MRAYVVYENSICSTPSGYITESNTAAPVDEISPLISRYTGAYISA